MFVIGADKVKNSSVILPAFSVGRGVNLKRKKESKLSYHGLLLSERSLFVWLSYFIVICLTIELFSKA